MELKYDEVFLNGSETEIGDFSYDHGVVIDWRHEDDLIVRDFASKLENENLSAEATDEGLRVNYNGANYNIPLTFSGKDRYITIRGLIGILKDKYEIRAFDESLGSDTHVFYIKPKEWWAFMDANFPERMKEIFYPVDDELDFFEGRARMYAFGPGK